jgi:deoxycytidylate deaminase
MFSHEDRRRDALILDLGSRPGDTNPNHAQLAAWADDLMRRDQGRSFGYLHPLEKVYGDIRRLSIEKTFHEGDFFVDLDRPEAAFAQIRRFVGLIFSNPHPTTTEDETALAHAFVAMRESAAIARRVGAAITVQRSLLMVGRNDIPEAGGGQFRVRADGESTSANPSESDASNEERKDVFRDVVRRLFRDEDWNDLLQRYGFSMSAALSADQIELLVAEAAALDVVRESRIFDLIEFNPTVHAEMSAITTAVRLGIALEGGTLYTTTFPCHECTRHVVAAGIRRVVYLEPYPKSRAEALFRGQVRLGEREGDVDEADNRVLYEPFMGVAPRRQGDLFSWVPRDLPSGEIQSWMLNAVSLIRSSIDPVVPDSVHSLRDGARNLEQQAAVEQFWELAASEGGERDASTADQG